MLFVEMSHPGILEFEDEVAEIGCRSLRPVCEELPSQMKFLELFLTLIVLAVLGMLREASGRAERPKKAKVY